MALKDMKFEILLQAKDKISKTFEGVSSATSEAKKQMKTATTAVRELNQQTKNLESLQDLKRTLADDAKQMSATAKKARELHVQINASGEVSKTTQMRYERLRNKLEKMQATKAKNIARSKTLSDALASAGVDTTNLSRAQTKLAADLSKANAAADKQGAALDKLRDRQNALTKAKESRDKLVGLSGNMAMGGAAAMATSGAGLAMGGRMLSAGIDFEEKMSAVGAVARIDKTSDAFKALKAQAQELGATTSFSASEAAAGMQYLSMAGFDANQTLSAMPGMLNLAKAGGKDLAETADIASNVLSGFGLQASEMTRLGDIMTATFTRSNVDLSMLGETMKYTAPIAKEFGSSVEEVAAMSGLLGNIGIQGSQAGTSLRGMYSRLSRLPKMAGSAMEDLGVATKDAEGNARPLFDILTDIASATENMGSADRLKAFTEIAGVEAGAAFAELVGRSGAGEIGKFAEILKSSSGEAARVASQMGDNAAGDIKAFWSAVEGMNIALTETNTSPLRDLIQSATGLVRSAQGWIKANPALAGGIFKVAAGLGALVFAGGAFISILAGIMGPFAVLKYSLVTMVPTLAALASGIVSIGSAALTVAVPAIKAIGAALKANPLGLAVTGLIMGAYLIWDNWEWLSEKFTAFLEWLPKALADAGKWIASNWQNIIPGGGLIKLAMDKFGDTDSGASKPVKTINMEQMAQRVTATKQAVAAANNNQIAGDNIQIVVKGGNDQNPQDIAAQVKHQLEIRDREKRRRHRGRLADGVN